ncbi:MAG: AAA family ATPase, partial [Deltaproteobacteria bacterium]|nr:AAA family ATPase [Deltaproteobacteria bacterium]
MNLIDCLQSVLKMKIISIQPYYFRAFGSNQPILLSKELNVFYGNNGTGKSSLAEAVEWLFFGYTRRRIKGDQYSKREYKGSYINKHCPLDINPFVEVVMENEEGQQHILRRTIIVNNPNDPTDDEYLLEFDNREIDYLEHAGLVFTEAHCPVVVQHGIQDFIHTRPIDRYRIISEALGLSQLVKFKDALESARKQLQSNPPDSVLNARRTLKKLSLDLGVIGLTDLQHRWQNGSVDLDGDYSTIIKTAQNLIGGTTSDIPQIIKELEIKQELEMKRVFDISPFRPPSTLETNTEKLIATVQHVKSSYEELKKTTKQLLDVHFNEQLKELVEFQTRGYELLEKHDTNEPWLCPFCKEKTITNELLTQIKDNLQKHEGNHNTQSAYDKQLGKTQQDLTHLRQQFEALQIPHLKRENQATLTSVFDKEKGKLEEFLKGNQEIQALTLTANSSVKRTEDSIKLLKNSDALEKILTSVDVLEKTLGKTFTALSNFSSGIKKYRTFFLNFEPVLIKELSDEESVARYTALLNLFRERPNANLVVRYQEFENQVLEARRKTDEHVLEKQTEVLSTQEQKILKWYETLSPNKNVRFSGIEPGKNLINLKATAFGEELNAAASMSQSQLNCLGLSIYIPSVLNEISPFNFIIFDDPVQAMDDDHHEAFKNNVVKKLLED